MDAAHKLLNKTALFFATALLIAAPVQAQSLIVSSNTVGLNDNQAKSIQVTASGSSTVSYGATGAPSWLNVISTNGFRTPDTLLFQLANTNCGTCVATVNLTPTAGGTAVPITVTYTPGGSGGGGGGGNGTLTATPNSLTLSATPGGTSVSQNVTLSTSTSSVTITGINTDAPSWLSAFVSGGSFTVTPTAPATLTVTANPFSLSAGIYTGHITITPSVGTATTITVVLTVGSGSGGNGTLTVSPTSLGFSAAAGQISPTATQNLTITNPSTSAVSVGIGSDVNWLIAQVVSGSVTSVTNASPLVISVAANASALTNGTYTGHLVINPSVGTPTTVTVTFTVGTGSGGGGGGSNGAITANPNSLSFTAATGQSTVAQNVTLTSPTTVTILGISSNVSWLTTTITTGSLTIGPNAPGNLSIIASAAALTNGTYNGQLTITPSSGTATVIAVTFTVGTGSGGGGGGGTGSIQVDKTSIAFNYPSSSLSTVLNISAGTSGQPTFNVVVASQNNWLRFSVNNVPAGVYQNVGFGQFLVSVDSATASTLPTGTYTGSLSLINPSNSNDVTTVNLTLAVNGGGSGGTGNLTVSPSALNFTASPGGAPQQQNLTMTVASGTSVQFTATAFNSGFLSVSSPGCAGSVNSTSPLTCTLFGSQTITVTVNPGALTILGDYTGQLQFVSGGTTVNAFVKMTLTNPVTSLTVNPTSLSFSASAGGASQTQTVAVAVPGQAQTQVSLTSFNGNFFTVSSSSCNLTPSTGTICTFTGNQTLNVTVNPSTLTATGAYNGIITIQSGGITQSVSVALNLNNSGGGGGSTSTIAAPSALTFAYQIGSGLTVPQQLITIAASGSFTATPNVQTAQQWLAASTIGTGPGGYVTVSVSPQGLGAGVYQGNIAITTTSGNVTVPVTLTVSQGVVVLATPGALNFTSSSSSIQTQTVSLVASDNSATPVTLTSSASWITVASGSSPTTPSTFVVTVSPGSLCNGLNTGTLTVGATNASNNGFTIPVVVLVSNSSATGCSNTGGTVLTVSPTSLSFAAQPGGNAPAPQSITVTSASGASGTSFTYSVSGNLTISATVNGTTIANGQTLATPATITITPSTAGLTPGTTYNNTITLTPVGGGAAVTVPVTLSVSSNPVITVTPTTLSFIYDAGTAVPSPQSVTVGGASGQTFTATASSTGNWLSVAPSSGTTPATLMVAVNPTGLAANTYTGTITVTGTGSASGSSTITVTLKVNAPLPTITSVSSAASYLGGSISPGEVITIFGTSIGPTPGVTLILDSTGKVSTTLAGVQVLINGFLSPMVYASNTQVSAVVPYEICATSCGPGTIAQVVVKFLGQSSNGIPTPVSSTTPAIFTANASGSGPGAILNANSSVNSPANPANKGDTIAIYLTGEGLTSPAGVTGKVTTVSSTPPITPVPLLPVAATIDGTPVSISFAGEAPGLVSGVMQLNVQIPAGARSGNLPLVVSIGGSNSQPGVTVSVR